MDGSFSINLASFKSYCTDMFIKVNFSLCHDLSDISWKEMATHSSTLAWKIPWLEEPVRLQSIGSQRVGHD